MTYQESIQEILDWQDRPIALKYRALQDYIYLCRIEEEKRLEKLKERYNGK